MAEGGGQCWEGKHMNRRATYPLDHGLALAARGQAPGRLLSRAAKGVLTLMFIRVVGGLPS